MIDEQVVTENPGVPRVPAQGGAHPNDEWIEPDEHSVHLDAEFRNDSRVIERHVDCEETFERHTWRKKYV